MRMRGYAFIPALPLTTILVATRPLPAQEIRRVHGCTLLDEESALRDAGLEHRDCDVALRLEIAPDGSVEDITFLRRDENEKCNDTLAAFARQTRWSPAPGVGRRRMSMGWWNDPRAYGDGDSGEFSTYPGGRGLDSDRYFLLAHRDPQVDLMQLRERHSRLGAFERIEEVRSDLPLLCAIGRDPEAAVVLRSAALDAAEHDEHVNAFEHAAATWPDLELIGAHAHTGGGSCFLLRAPAE
jgi:hypothetical protein